jgi:TPR repeat protein
MKRVKVNDPLALNQVGARRLLDGDYEGAFEYLTKAVELGDVDAHYQLSVMYHEGNGVEKDEKKELHHLEEAAIAGHPVARHNLGCYEGMNGRMERAVKHLIIAANLGYDDSIKGLKEYYANGQVSKEDFAAALRAHKAAVDATKSPQREEGEFMYMMYGRKDH